MHELPLAAESHGREPSRLLARVAPYDRPARLRRAAAIFLPLLAAALVSLPIPGWHFAGVPGFLIAAFVLGRRRLRQAFAIDSIEGPCPACALDREYAPADSGAFPMTVRCPSCGEFLKLSTLR